MSIPYRFMPFARRGLARAHSNADAAGSDMALQPRITVGLTLQAKRDGNAVTAVSGNVPLRLYGPADIIGIDQRLVVRTDPKPDATDFEPNYLAAVDFDPPDFPWLLTPARADSAGRLRPWLVLVVLERPGAKLPALQPGHPLPSISLGQAQVRDELPDLDESWLWAHAQAVSEAPDTAALAAQLKAEPARNVSRLVCPRRLKPRTDYLACVVPATDGGCRRGLGRALGEATALRPAWSTQAPADLQLPVYFSWTFSTGPVGDIETLARRLRTPAQYGGDAQLVQQLRGIGQRNVWVDGDRLLFDGAQPGQTVFEGAMVSIGFDPAAANQLYATKLAAMLNSGSARSSSGSEPTTEQPTLSPPIYGEHHARRHTVDTARVGQHWLDGLSLQPRYRLVAGWGAEVVRQNQDEFMQAAWEQLGDILAAERAFSLARLARDVLKRVEVRHLAQLPPHRVLALMAPARARIAVAPALSLYGRIQNATLPHELFDGAMRRIASPHRAALKMARWRGRTAAVSSVGLQMASLVERFASATRHVEAIDPNRFVPDGILGSRSYDSVPLPGLLDERVDMKPHTGLDFSLSGHQLKALQEANAVARQHAASSKKRPRGTGDIWRQGLLTETHMLRIEQLQAAAGAPLVGDVISAIRNSSTRGTEGVLLAVKNGVVTSQALRIDGRSGAVKTAGSAFVAHGGSRSMRAQPRDTVALTRVATVPLRALKLYGNNAVFATLPPSTLGRGVADVQVGLGGAGRFTRVPPAEPGAPVTITMPPALKDYATLSRYSTAFKAYEKTLHPAAEATVGLKAVDFATATSAAQLKARINADRTVPARLAGSLQLGEQSVALAGGAFDSPFISGTFNSALPERLRYVVPRTFDRVMAYPKLPFPLSRKLETLAPDVFLPGVGVLPSDFIMAVQTNPRFVDALMLGANHEMARELLWQGLPTDQRGTPFRHFWQRLDGGTDIEPIHHWDAVPLGQQAGGAPMVVLLFRGRLLERYPNLTIYAYPMNSTDERGPGAGDAAGQMLPARIELPVLRGRLLSDIHYVGFRIRPQDIGGFFFIVEEHMTEPRFGFDERVGNGQNSNSWQDV
ncbi:MAG TPA: hypothetical protein VK439_04005, partial [Rubrivivax sp.]|nr:hypothetical protein [Rubrivivax sp.]